MRYTTKLILRSNNLWRSTNIQTAQTSKPLYSRWTTGESLFTQGEQLVKATVIELKYYSVKLRLVNNILGQQCTDVRSDLLDSEIPLLFSR